MCGTHICMTSSPPATARTTVPDAGSAPAAVAPPAVAAPVDDLGVVAPDGQDADLDRLDELLVELRRVLLRPGYRRVLLGDLAGSVGLATVRLLRTVQRAGEPPSIGTVAEVLAIDPSTASRLVDRAAEEGLLERRACADDRRRARLHLSPDGEELLAAVTARRRAVLAAAVDGWDPDDLVLLQVLVDRLLVGFDLATGSA